jgi:amino acid transporter
MAEVKLKRELSTADLVIYGIMFIIPVAPFAWYGTYLQEAGGMVALGYLIALIAMLFTGFSYAQMASRYPVAGSVYSYVQIGTTPELGFMAGWAICLDYIFLPAVAYLIGAMFIAQLVPGVPQWAWVVIFVVFTTVINVLGIRPMSWVSWGLFVFQCFVIIYFLVAVVIKISQGSLHFNAVAFYNSSHFDISKLLQAIVIVFLSYLGFDAVSTLGEEAKNASKSVARGTIYSILGVGAIFIVLSYFAGVAYPHYERLNSGTAFLDILRVVGGTPLVDLAIVAITVSFGVACALEGEAAVARILYSMGRDGILPKVLSTVHPKWQSPWVSTVLIGVLSAAVAIAVGLTQLANVLAFGALTGFMALNLTVIWHFYIRAPRRSGVTFLYYVVSPALGFGLCVWIFTSMNIAAYEVGCTWLAVGFLYLLAKTRAFRKAAPTLGLGEVLEPETSAGPAIALEGHPDVPPAV